MNLLIATDANIINALLSVGGFMMLIIAYFLKQHVDESKEGRKEMAKFTDELRNKFTELNKLALLTEMSNGLHSEDIQEIKVSTLEHGKTLNDHHHRIVRVEDKLNIKK